MYNNRYQENDRYDNRNYSERRPNNDWNEYMRNDNNDSSREDDRKYDYRQNRDQDCSPPRDNGRQQHKGGHHQNKQNQPNKKKNL